MNSKKNKTSLAAAFGVDVDELDAVEELSDDVVVDDSETSLDERPDISVEVEPGIVRYGNMEFVKAGESLMPLGTNVQVNFTLTAIERHRLKKFADAHRMTMVEVVREALKNYMKDN